MEATGEDTNVVVHDTNEVLHKIVPNILPALPLYKYKEKLREHFRLHENLGLPARGREDENTDPIELRDLFVQPTCTYEYINPDGFDEALRAGNNPALPILPLLAENRRLVVLGDPGIGKSTLVQWLIITLAQDDETEDTPDKLKNCIPLPFRLNDLGDFLKKQKKEPKDWTWELFLKAFRKYKPHQDNLSSLMAPFGDAEFRSLLDDERAIFLLDGVDEIGNEERRVALRRVIWQGFQKHTKARWVITSRLIGYECAEVDVERLIVNSSGELRTITGDKPQNWPFECETRTASRKNESDDEREIVGHEKEVALRLHLAPFDDKQQLLYATNWYVKRLDETRGEPYAKKFIKEVHSHPSTRVIGRVPNLLHLLALLYQHQAKLPNGRFNVYKSISEAYLESIDRARGLNRDYQPTMEVDWRVTEGWLAAIAWEMQRRRTSEAQQNKDKKQAATRGEILATHDEIMAWGVAELKRDGHPDAEKEFKNFLKFVGRRSGLLIPRSNEQYGFTHLSFLEYYAALAVRKEHSRLRTPPDSDSIWDDEPTSTTNEKNQVEREDFARWANEPLWHEVLTFLAESYGAPRDEPATRDLLALLFPQLSQKTTSEAVPDDEKKPLLPLSAARLLAALSLNPHVALSEKNRGSVWNTLWQAYLDWPVPPTHWDEKKTWNIGPALLAEDDYRAKVI